MQPTPTSPATEQASVNQNQPIAGMEYAQYAIKNVAFASAA